MVAQIKDSPSTSVMEVDNGEEDDHHQKKKWWLRLVDMEEAKRQLGLSFPMILTNASLYMIPLVSMMFVGHLGELQLAGSALATSWTAIGLSGALETLCGQAYGAQLHTNLGIYLQSSCIISFLFSITIAIMWWYTEPILLLLHQNPTISKEAALYMKYSIPIVFAYGFLQNIQRFQQTQSVVFPLMVYSLLSLAIHFLFAYVFIHLTGLGFKGAPVSVSVSLWISVILLVFHVKLAKEFRHTWNGVSFESLSHIYTNLKLALPSAATVCLEYWAFEIMCSYPSYHIHDNFWIKCSSKHETIERAWIRIPEESKECNVGYTKALTFHGSYCAFYLIGMPIAVLLAFKCKLYTKGLWIGLICGLFFQTFTLFLIATLRKWTRIELEEKSAASL
ncbi:hypothetical protein V2J09_007330 [Rumex salicifolius]